MAFDQTTRNRLARFVSDARALLTEEFTRQLQNEYGLDPASGDVTPIDRLTALDDRRRETALILRETLEYYLAGNSNVDSKATRDVLDRIVREQAFTVLNRLCAFRMSEARGLVLESIAKGYQSKGFQLYARLAGSALGETGEAYRMYIFSLMDEFSVDLPALFDRFSPQGRLFPREAALLKLLGLINDPEIEPLWAEDETIGWIYQYFNSKEERQKMRAESQAPRNSRELAVRNQFFTPRYVVEFLTDNTLGRIWYEMTRGETALKDSCRYLERRKHVFFLEEGQEVPEPFLLEQLHETDPDLAHEMWLPPNDQITDLYTIFLYGLTAGGYDYAREQWGIECGELANEKLKQYHEVGKWEGTFDELRCCLFFEQRRYHHFGEDPEGDDAKAILDLYQAICERWNLEVEYIPHRLLKDPREIKMLDPACGSMHFGLYAFDLFEQIYAEAWVLEERLGENALQRLADLDPLHKTYHDKETYLKDVPRLIIERNIHGVDIDPRAVQIAGLSLWLRAQKSWQAQGLRLSGRPQIRKSNVVCAESMPGDQQLLEEFLTTLRGERLEVLMRKAWHVPADQKIRATPQMADALAKLVRTVWQEMELAGEAGSLLKIEETLREAINTARKASEEKSPLFRVLEYGLNESPKEKYVQVVAVEDQDFFDRAEGLVLASLKDYAEQAVNGNSFKRRLFTEDAVQGFAFIDLCRIQYDIVLMNPPFGVAANSTKPYISSNYLDEKQDISSAFVARCINNQFSSGMLGAITTKTIFSLASYENWRKKFIFGQAKLALGVELGVGVLDDAMVETICFTTVKTREKISNSLLVTCNDFEQKADALIEILSRVNNGVQSEKVANNNINEFANIPGSPLCFGIPKDIFSLYMKVPKFEQNFGTVKQGLITADDFRFLRAWWEIPPQQRKLAKWFPVSKGGEYSTYFDDIHLYVNWDNNGNEIRCYSDSSGNLLSRPQGINYYFKPGLTYPFRSQLGFSVRPLPEGCVFTLQGSAIFPELDDLYGALSFFNSSLAEILLKIISSFGAWQVGYVGSLPYKKIPDKISILAKELVYKKRNRYLRMEESLHFIKIFEDFPKSEPDEIQELEKTIDDLIFNFFDIDVSTKAWPRKVIVEGYQESEVYRINTEISFLWGAFFGRWDIRYSLTKNLSPELPDPFAALPICPPGMLQNGLGLPATPRDVSYDYPIRISWDGIIVDDEGNNEDLEQRLRDVLQIIWKDKAESVEQEACQGLGVHSLREYCRKPTLFFAEHLKRYSKSRRVAPIYWPLSTPSCSYTLWLYYHRLNNQTLYTCVNDFVDPKLKQVSEEAARLRLKKGRSAAEEKELERLTDFERELKDFREELLRVAKFWKPNLNDGVEITAAPLWKLFQHKPWQKRLIETWQKLEAGEYDWAHLAYSIWPERVREKCKADKSLAIAHDLEELYVEPPASTKKKKAKKPAVDEETEGWFNDD